MSHNSIKVNNISVSNDDVDLTLDSIVGSATANQVITYNGSNFVASDATSSKGYDLKFATFQKSGGYSANPSYTFAINDYFCARVNTASYTKYTAAGFTLNTATAGNSAVTSGSWMESVDIPASTPGTYLITATSTCRNVGTNVTYQLESNAGAFSAKMLSNNGSWYGGLIGGILTTTGADIVRLVIKAKSGTIPIPDDLDQYFFTFNILKLA
jgi:hypothetical protein